MSFQPKHCGLYFTDENLRLARENRQREPIRSALARLRQPGDAPLVSAQLAGLRWRLWGDAEAALPAIDSLRQVNDSQGSGDVQSQLRHLLAWLSVLEMLREHPAWRPLQSDWLAALEARLDIIMPAADDASPLDGLWFGALNLAAGIVLERAAYFQRGQESYQQAIHGHIHPEGFLKGIVDVHDVTQSYSLQVSGTCALVLMAEMAWHVGVDLWSFDNRGVTPITAATYLLYYYFYPERWKWEARLTRETTESVMRTQGAFIEMVNRRHRLPGIDHLFMDLRPMFGAAAGGLTTLTHGIPPPPKKKRWRWLNAFGG